MIVSGSGSITGSVVQICGLSNPFLQRYVIDLVSLFAGSCLHFH